MISDEHIRELMRAAIDQAFQKRVATIWNNVTLAGGPSPEPAFKEGVTSAIKFYRQAIKAIEMAEL